MVLLRLAILCSQSVSNALGEGCGHFDSEVGGFDVKHRGLAVHDCDASGLLDPPFEVRLELLPQFDGDKVEVGIDVAEVVGGVVRTWPRKWMLVSLATALAPLAMTSAAVACVLGKARTMIRMMAAAPAAAPNPNPHRCFNSMLMIVFLSGSVCPARTRRMTGSTMDTSAAAWPRATNRCCRWAMAAYSARQAAQVSRCAWH